MKKPKSKDITDDFLGGNTAEAKPAVVTELGKKMGDLPTTEQLALIAATLARNTTDTPDNLTKTAMALWFSARQQIFYSNDENEVQLQDHHFEQVMFEQDEYYNEMAGDRHFLPIPDEYPVTRDQFLRVMLPKYKSRTADLARIAKAFVCDTLRERSGIEPSQDEINDAYGKWKPYENPDHANAVAKRFEQWREWHVKQARSAAGLKSAAKKAVLKKRRSVKPPREK
jgi:hypothetical protein